MGLNINKGPKWEDDAFGYINKDTTELNILKRNKDTNYYETIYRGIQINEQKGPTKSTKVRKEDKEEETTKEG